MFSALGIILALYFASTLGHENATLSPWYEKYLGLAVEKDAWPRMVRTVYESDSNSRIECGARCSKMHNADRAACNAFAVHESSCFLARMTRLENETAAGGMSTPPPDIDLVVYVREESVSEAVAHFDLVVPKVNSRYWTRYIHHRLMPYMPTDTDEMKGDKCAACCRMEINECQMYVATSEACYLGRSSFHEDGVAVESMESADIKFNEDFMKGISGVRIPDEEAADADWKQFVYAQHDGIRSALECAAACLFEYEEEPPSCHFSVYGNRDVEGGGTCLFGSFDDNATGFVIPDGIKQRLPIRLKTERVNGAQRSKFTDYYHKVGGSFSWRTPDTYKTKIFQVLSGLDYGPIGCSAMCFFGGRMTCHFFVILENGEGACLLGNYDADETIFDDNRTDLRVKFREDVATAEMEAKFVRTDSVAAFQWEEFILEDVPDASEKWRCAAICLAWLAEREDSACDLYVWKEDKCYLEWKCLLHWRIPYRRLQAGQQVVAPLLDTYYPIIGDQQPDEWRQQIIAAEDLTVLDEELRLSACRVLCHYREALDPCNFYVLDNPICYLGHSGHFGSTVEVDATGALPVYGRFAPPCPSPMPQDSDKWFEFEGYLYYFEKTAKQDSLNASNDWCKRKKGTGEHPHSAELMDLRTDAQNRFLKCVVKEEALFQPDGKQYRIGTTKIDHKAWLAGDRRVGNTASSCHRTPVGSFPKEWIGLNVEDPNEPCYKEGAELDEMAPICQKNRPYSKANFQATSSNSPRNGNIDTTLSFESNAAFAIDKQVQPSSGVLQLWLAEHSNDWLQIDMGTSRWVDMVLMVLGPNPSGMLNASVEVRVGDLSVESKGLHLILDNEECTWRKVLIPDLEFKGIWLPCRFRHRGRYVTVQNFSVDEEPRPGQLLSIAELNIVGTWLE